MEDMDQVPLTAVPILLQIIGSPDHAQRDETLAVLCDLVSSCYDSDGDALGAAVREADGLLTLSWLLAETDANVVKQTLFLLANLASDAVDPRAYLTKRTLRQCGCEYRLLPCLDHEDDEVISYACGALQNLCNDPEWSQVLLDQGVVSRLEVRACTATSVPTPALSGAVSGLGGGALTLPARALASQELVDHPTDLVARYSAGALKNLMATLAEAGFDPVSPIAFSLTLLSYLL